MEIDLNADLGEGAGFDAELMPLITSANVCCGLHAGGPTEMWETLDVARNTGLEVGAHSGYADGEQFGRAELAVTGDDVFRSCQYQLGALYALTRILHVELRYVKPHGAMYNQACRDRALACGIIEAAEGFN